MNCIEVFNQVGRKIAEIEDMQKIIDFTVKYEDLHDIECSVILVDKKTIHEMNKTYRGIDRPTDVISFALEDEKNMILVEGRALGDIYISLDTAEEQAQEYGHSLQRELCFLTIHGFLHLLGYDHMDEKEETVMFAKQKEILDSYGIYR